MNHAPIDLLHMGIEGAIACYLMDADGPAIVDPGPATTLERLAAELADRGVGNRDLRHVLITHVHLDHAGATGRLTELYPRATVHVHSDGAPHLVDPTRLVASTRRTFGDRHDRLWGEVRPVPRDRVRLADRRPGPGPLRVVPTPGHISHHLAYLDERNGTIYSGDSLGIVVAGGPTHPPTPPPAVDLPAWHQTLEEVRRLGSERFAATHFGVHNDLDARVGALDRRLHDIEARVRRALASGDEEDADRYQRETLAEQSAHADGKEVVERYFATFPAKTDWEGVAFFLRRNP